MDGFSTKEEIIARIRDIVKRPRAMEDLRAALKSKDLGLKLDCKTRWNSLREMCSRALAKRPELDEYCLSNPEFQGLFLSGEEWASVAAICGLLESYQEATDEFSAANHPTIHLALPYLQHLKTYVETVASSDQVSN